MGTVTGYTAERMKEIENASVVNGDIDPYGHLILTRFDESTIDAGIVTTSPKICTSTTRPTGGALYDGLEIYETDTDRKFIWDGASWVYSGGLIICTSATRPTLNLFEGLEIYETNTNNRLVYDGAVWNLPKNVSGGTLGYSQVTVAQGGITVETDITGLTQTLTLLPNRRIKITAKIERQSSVANDGALFGIKEGVNYLGRGVFNIDNTVDWYHTQIETIITPAAGIHTYRATLVRVSGTGVLSSQVNANSPNFFLVEDIGGV